MTTATPTTRRTRNWGNIGFAIVLTIMLVLVLLASFTPLTVEHVWTIFLVLGIIPATTFIISYELIFPRWRKSIEGRHMMTLTFFLDMLMVEELAQRIFGRWEYHDTFLAVVIGGVVLTMWQRYAMLMAAWHDLTPATLTKKAKKGDTHD
jgi:hypothetical protein